MKAQRNAVVVVTGASAGVGRAIVREFAKRGNWIGLVAREPDRLEVTRKEAAALGGRAIAVAADIADPVQVEAAAQRVEDELGPIDIWINNAMVTVFSPLKEVQPEEVRRVTEVTYLGAVYGTMVALRHMLPRDHGSIVQVGSGLAYRAIPLQAAYCGAKHALKGFTESLRCELIHDKSKVNVTMVQLPGLNTIIYEWAKSRLSKKPQPVPPIYQPEVAARAVY